MKTGKRELLIKRVFDVPRETVFEAWTDPEQVMTWCGPTGCAKTVYEIDIRPGGIWRFAIHGPYGIRYGNRIEYREIVKPNAWYIGTVEMTRTSGASSKPR